MAILTGAPQLPPPRKGTRAVAPPRRRPPVPPAQSTARRTAGRDDDSENVAPRRAAPRREPPAKPAPKKAPQRKPPAPKSSDAGSSTPRLALAQMSTNGSNEPARGEAPDEKGGCRTPGSATPTNELGPCPRQVPQLPSTKDDSPDLWLQPQHSTSEDEGEDDELLRAVEAEVAATAEMLKTEKCRSAYSSSESDDESDLDASNDDVDRRSSHTASADSADSPDPAERAAREEEDADVATDEVDTGAARDGGQSADTEAEITPECEEELFQDSVVDETAAKMLPIRQSAAQDAHSNALTPTKSQVDVSTMSPEMGVPTFSIRASRSISSCFDTGSSSEATAVVSRPIVQKVRGLSLSSQPRRTATEAPTMPFELSELSVANTPTVAPSEYPGSEASDGSISTDVVRLRQRVATLEKQLAAKETALIEAFAIIDQLSVDRGAA
eukprot:COSAG02_NODE_5_length_66751_cov_63.939148_16_plen_442_part_00